jgi:hypothetical protein
METDLVSQQEAALLSRDLDSKPLRQAFVLVLDQKLTRDDVANRVAARLDQVPRFRCITAGWPQPVWTPDPGFDLYGHVREIELTGSLEEWLAGRLQLPSDRSHPLWELWLVEAPGSPGTVLVCFSHPAVAARGHLLSVLLDPAPTSIPPATLPGLPAADDPLQSLAGLGRGLQAALDGAKESVRPRSRELFLAGIELQLPVITRVAKSLDAAVHDVLTALVCGGVESWLGGTRSDQIALVPMAIQHDGRFSIVARGVALPLGSSSAAERLETLASYTAAHVASGIAVGAGALRLRPVFDQHSSAALAMADSHGNQLYLANAPGAWTPAYFGPARVSGISAFTTPDDEILAIGITSAEQRITLALAANAPLAGFGSGMLEALAQLRSRGGE